MPETFEAKIGPRLRALLDPLLQAGNFQLSYQFQAQPPDDQESPELVVDFEGADAGMLLAMDGELLRAFEHLTVEALRLSPGDHHKLSFDCQGRRRLRVLELRTLAGMAAERVLKNGVPYAFAPMHARDRRTVHLTLRDIEGVRSESEGEGRDRHIVVRSASTPAGGDPGGGGRREYRRL